MDIDPNKALLLDLNFRTSLLESLDWNEYHFELLLNYLQTVLSDNDVSPKEILEFINSEYGLSTHNLIKQIFDEAYIENGLYIKPEGDHEH